MPSGAGKNENEKGKKRARQKAEERYTTGYSERVPRSIPTFQPNEYQLVFLTDIRAITCLWLWNKGICIRKYLPTFFFKPYRNITLTLNIPKSIYHNSQVRDKPSDPAPPAPYDLMLSHLVCGVYQKRGTIQLKVSIL